MKRQRICRKIKGTSKRKCYYVQRNKKGQITKVTNVGRGIAIDKRKYVGSKRIPKTKGGKPRRGYGHLGDYARKRRK